MSIKKKRLLTLAGIIAFAALIIALFLFAVKQRDANTSGDFGTIQYTTLGTIQEMSSPFTISQRMKMSGLFRLGALRCLGRKIPIPTTAG